MTDLLLTSTEMANIIFLAIQQHKTNENKIVTDIIKFSLEKINQKTNEIKDMQNVCDTLMECFDLYNAFVKEKHMNLPLISESSYNMVVILLNNVIGEMRSGN